MHSCLYEGYLRHRRFAPRPHQFRYRLFLAYLDLSELPQAFAGHPLWSYEGRGLAQFRRRDHLGDPEQPLEEAVRDLVAGRTGETHSGPIRLLTHLRYFGYYFNPVSFYFLFDQKERVETVVAEINNTPWGEQYCYVLDESMNLGSNRHKRYRFPKDFHVSPFMSMEVDYDWFFTTPGKGLSVHMDNLSGGDKFFDATMVLHRRPITRSSLTRALLRFPLMTARVTSAIYWNALLIWAKGNPFFTHPKTLIQKLEADTR